MRFSSNRAGQASVFLALFGCAAFAWVETADGQWPDDEGHRLGFQVRMIDQQFFTTPYERAAILGGAYMGEPGSAASTIHNPAALSSVCMPDVEAYWVTDSFDGEVGLTPTPSATAQDASAYLNDVGFYAALPLDSWPVSFGVGGDYFSTAFSPVEGPQPGQDGTRLSAALAAPIFGGISVGYGLTWFDDYIATAAWREVGSTAVSTRFANKSTSWRHRFAIYSDYGCQLRWGLQFDYGYGRGNNTYDGVEADGADNMKLRAGRAGLQWDITQRIGLALEYEYAFMELNWGQPPGGVHGSGATARWATDTHRPMVGIQFAATPSTALHAGYRYTIYNLRDFHSTTRDGDYGSVAAGVRHSFWGDRAMIGWTIEKSWIAEDDLLNVVTLNCAY